MQVQVQFRGHQHHHHHHHHDHHGRICWSPSPSFLKHSPPHLHRRLPFTPLRVQLGPQHQPPMPVPVPVITTSDHSLDINLINLHLHPELAVPEQDSTDIKGEENRLGHVMALGLMFASWNLFNIYFNIFNKQVLKVYPFPMTLTAVQFGIGSLLVLLMWATNLHKPPNFSSLSHSRSQLQVIAALAAVHTMGNAFTNMSLLKVAVSFTHTIKAMEPFFSVLLSALFLHQRPSGMAIAALIPIVGGVALASFTEVSFNWIGFWSAMASNLANQSRNVVSKKLMNNREESLGNINFFSLITIFSFIFSVLLMVFTEGVTFTPIHLQTSGLDVREIYVRSLLAGLCFHAYQQAGYMLLEHVSPVSHSVGNCAGAEVAGVLGGAEAHP